MTLNWKAAKHLGLAAAFQPVFAASVALGGFALIVRVPVLVGAGIVAAGYVAALLVTVRQLAQAGAGDTGRAAGATSVSGRRAPNIHQLPAAPTPGDDRAVDAVPAPERGTPSPEDMADFVANAKRLGVTNVVFTVHGGTIAGLEDTSEGLVVDLSALTITSVQRNVAGTALGAFSDGNELISFIIPRHLIDDGVEGFMFTSTLEEWNDQGATVDIEWEVGIDDAVTVFVAGHHNGNKITLGRSTVA